MKKLSTILPILLFKALHHPNMVGCKFICQLGCGGQTENLTHPKANPGDIGSPNAQLLDVFPPFFAKAPYGPN
jgi:hypothetical protein